MYPVLPLGEVSQNFDTKRVPIKESERINGFYPYYGASGIVDYVSGYIFDGEYLLIAEDGENLRTRNTPVAFIAKGKFWVNNHAHIIQGNEKALTKYLGYAVNLADINSFLTGSTMPKLTQGNLNRVPIVVPPLKIQEKIVNVIGTIDDKIEINNQMNETLEAMARAIFKEWFIDFGPVRAKAEGRRPFGMDDETAALFPDSFEESELGMIPKGWRVVTIDDVCHFQNGYAFKSNLMTTNSNEAKRIFKMGNIVKGGGFNADGSDDYYPNAEIKGLDRYLAQKGDLLMCMTDMKNNVALLGNTALMQESDTYLVNQRVGLLRTKNEKNVNYPFLYLLTNEPFFLDELRSKANSGVQVNLSTDEIKKSKLTLPPETIHKIFNNTILPMFERIESNRIETKSLKSIRDILLPKLISGELSIERHKDG